MQRFVDSAPAEARLEIIGHVPPGGSPVFRRKPADYDLVLPYWQQDGTVHFLAVSEPGPALVEGGAR